MTLLHQEIVVNEDYSIVAFSKKDKKSKFNKTLITEWYTGVLYCKIHNYIANSPNVQTK